MNGEHRMIHANQADPLARGVVNHEAGVPRASLWLSVCPVLIGPPIKKRRQERRKEIRLGGQLQCHFQYKWSYGADDRQG